MRYSLLPFWLHPDVTRARPDLTNQDLRSYANYRGNGALRYANTPYI
ncbi:hypothetical protein [Coleofasciculus sp. F4-SAH-05]